MSNLNTPAEEWLKEQFEFEYCEECGGDWDAHTAVPLLGNWFALCTMDCTCNLDNPPAIAELCPVCKADRA